MPFVPTWAASVSFVLSARRMACISCGTVLSNLPIRGVAERKSFTRCTGSGSPGCVKANRLPQTPAFISVKPSLYSLYVLGLFLSFVLFPDVCSFVQYWSDPGLVVAYSTGLGLCL